VSSESPVNSDVRRALDALLSASPDDPRSRPAAEALAAAVVRSAGDGARAQVRGARYEVREVTWPVEPEGGGPAFACPHIALTLLRNDAALLDVRNDYFDGRTTYRTVGERIGRWSRFRMGSPGDRGYDLHPAQASEVRAFAEEAPELVAALGLA
jgi:hypothetical protein